MDHRCKVSAGAAGILLLFFFIFSALYMNEVDVSGITGGQRTGIVSRIDVNKFHLESIDARYDTALDDTMTRYGQGNTAGWRGAGQPARIFSAGLLAAVLLWERQPFFPADSGSFFVFFQSEMFCLARPLSELFIRQRKDGKKRTSAF